LHTFTIREHRLDTIAGKEVVKLDGSVESGDETQVTIWLTEKAMGIARVSLRLCGFDIDKNDLSVLDEEKYMLAGKHVQVMTDEWNGHLRSQVVTNSAPGKKRCKELTQMLRSAKRENGEPPINATTASPNSASFNAAVASAQVDDHEPGRREFVEDGNDLPF
jgi:hypothetical protein